MFRTLKIITKEKKKITIAIVMNILDAICRACIMGGLYFVGYSVLTNSFELNNMIKFTIYLLCMVIARIIFHNLGYILNHIGGAENIRTIRKELSEQIKHLNLAKLGENSIGMLTARMTTDMSDFENVVNHLLSDIVQNIFVVGTFVVMAWFTNPVLGAIETGAILIAIPVIYFSDRVITNLGNKSRKANEGTVDSIIEYIEGMKTFRAYNLTGENLTSLQDAIEEQKNTSFKLEAGVAPVKSLFILVLDLTIAIIAFYSGTLFLKGEITIIELFMHMLLGIGTMYYFKEFANISSEYSMMKLAGEKILDLYKESEKGVLDRHENYTSFDIEVKDVGFSYDNKNLVLDGVSFKAPQGTKTALVGSSGSGKSTLCNLIAKFWEVEQGDIKIGSKSIKGVEAQDVLRNISMVFQEVYLMNDTIYNNLSLANPKATRKEIETACKIARCHDFIINMKEGYNTLIGEGGSTLSGGEKQRVSLARAILKDSPILLLDEATSSVDIENEIAMRDTLDIALKDKTVIMIAHKLASVKECGNIIVLECGKIVEQGTHEQLIENKDRYYDLWRIQERA